MNTMLALLLIITIGSCQDIQGQNIKQLNSIQIETQKATQQTKQLSSIDEEQSIQIQNEQIVDPIPSNISKDQQKIQYKSLKVQDKTEPKEQAQIIKKQEQQKISAHKLDSKTIQTKLSNKFFCGVTGYLRNQIIKSQQKQRMKLVKTNYGFDMYVDSKDQTVSKIIINTGTWQPHFINLIGHLVKPGDNVLNLGSQSGLEAIVMGKIIGPTGKLFIFEPYSFSYQILTKNIQLNGLKEITKTYKIGASDQKSKGYIQIFYSNTGGSSITLLAQNQNSLMKINPTIGQTQQVQTDRVDTLLPADISLDFAFIDVQKMQVKAMRGMKQIISRSPNLIIMVQWQYTNNRQSKRIQTQQFLTFMTNEGYRIYTYSGGDVARCRIGQFYQILDKQSLFRINFMDIFFFPKSNPPPKNQP